MEPVTSTRANGPKRLATELSDKFSVLPKKAKSEIILLWTTHFLRPGVAEASLVNRIGTITSRRVYPTPKERAWLKEQIELYYADYFEANAPHA